MKSLYYIFGNLIVNNLVIKRDCSYNNITLNIYQTVNASADKLRPFTGEVLLKGELRALQVRTLMRFSIIVYITVCAVFLIYDCFFSIMKDLFTNCLLMEYNNF